MWADLLVMLILAAVVVAIYWWDRRATAAAQARIARAIDANRAKPRPGMQWPDPRFTRIRKD